MKPQKPTEFERITRNEFQSADRSESAGVRGSFGEKLIGAEFDLFTRRSRYYDVYRDETRGQVKQTHVRIDKGTEDRYVPVKGRFRLWKANTLQLLKYGRREGTTAFVAFVLFEEDEGDPIGYRKVDVEDVVEHVEDELTGWDESGHTMGLQQKVPIHDVFEGVKGV